MDHRRFNLQRFNLRRLDLRRIKKELIQQGPRLVIVGAILGACSLSAFLWSLALSAILAPPVQAARSESEIVQPVGYQVAPPMPMALRNCSLSEEYPYSVRRWCDPITHYAEKRGLPPDLVAVLIWHESVGDPLAYSYSGAVGLMQIMPSDGIAAGYLCYDGPCFRNRPTTKELEDPEFNISYGTRMLADMVTEHGGLREALRHFGPGNAGYAYADSVLGIYQQYSE